MMSQDDQGLLSVRSNSSTTTRRALNSLQYASNGKDVVGLSPRKSSRLNIMMNSNTNISNKKVDMSCGINQPLSKSRTSISLPDISGSKSIAARSPAILALCASTSTPHRKSNASSTKSPSKSGSSAVARKNISVIMEEKENPNAAMSLAAAAAKSTSRPKMPKFKSSSTQCDLIDELMVTGDVETTNLTPYWKLMAHKRLAALDEAEAETVQVNRHMAEMNEENETLRNKIACYVEILRQYDEIKKQILESIDCCDEDEDEDDEDDSGYEKSTLSAN